MERDGLITKSRGSGRWNNHIVVDLTEKGEQAYRQSLNKGIIQEILTCFTAEEYQVLFSMLKRLRGNALDKTTQAREVPFP
jgi:DNA-binding MarR family transcriptional regulator